MTAYPKSTNNRNPALLELARGKECLLRVPGVCNNDTTTTVAAHSNELSKGKGRGRKADDNWSVQSCAKCHFWLDFGSATKQDKQEAFAAAHQRQLIEWCKIADSYSESPRAQKAAQWGLDRSEK